MTKLTLPQLERHLFAADILRGKMDASCLQTDVSRGEPGKAADLVSNVICPCI